MSTRYFFYLIFNNMLVNVLAFVPFVLLEGRFSGAVSSLLVGTVVGSAFMFLFTRLIARYPNQGLPEIMKGAAPRWVRAGVSIAFIVMWYLAGTLTMLVFTAFTIRFINPESSNWQVLGLFMFVLLIAARFRSKSVLFTCEIVLLLTVPLIAIILFKSLFNPFLEWDAVKAVAQYVSEWPTWKSISAATYLFSGYANLAVFNRCLSGIKIKWLWLIPPLGLSVLFTTVFIPIGFLGADDVAQYTFPWMTTTDSIRIEFGFVERVIFIFYLLYGGIAFVSMLVHWHISFMFLDDLWPRKPGQRHWIRDWTVGAVFLAGVAIMAHYWNDPRLEAVGAIWLQTRFGMEILLVALMIWMARRKPV